MAATNKRRVAASGKGAKKSGSAGKKRRSLAGGYGPCGICRWTQGGCQGFQGGGMTCNNCGHPFERHL